MAGTGAELQKLLEDQEIQLSDKPIINRKKYSLNTLSALLEGTFFKLHHGVLQYPGYPICAVDTNLIENDEYRTQTLALPYPSSTVTPIPGESVQLSADHRELALAHFPFTSFAHLIIKSIPTPQELSAAAQEVTAAK